MQHSQQIHTALPTIEPGLRYRDIKGQIGLFSVLDIANEDIVVKNPEGFISTKSLVEFKEAFAHGALIEEPALYPRNASIRVWVHSQAKMLQNITGILKTGSGWFTNDDSAKYYLIHTPGDTPPYFLRYDDATIMHSTDFITEHGDQLFEFDILGDAIAGTSNNFQIIFYNLEQKCYVMKPINGMTNQLYLNGSRWFRLGNIFENPEYYDLFVKATAQKKR